MIPVIPLEVWTAYFEALGGKEYDSWNTAGEIEYLSWFPEKDCAEMTQR